MSDLQKIKEQVSIYDVAESLLRLEKQDGKYKYPGERTASIKLYPENNRFHDFGRNVNGDIFDLMIHVRGCTLKEATAELKTAFNIKDSLIGKNVVKEAWIAYLERKFNAKYVEHYDYFLTDQNGKIIYAYTKVRLQDKAGEKIIIYGRFNGDRFILGLQGKKTKDIPAIYGSSIREIQEAIEHQKTIFYVEGEKDTNTLMRKGYTVFTCGGSGDWKKSVSEIVRQANVIILADNDEPGEQLAYQVMQDLQLISNSVSIIKPTQMVRSTKDSLNGLARNMNTIGNEMSNNLINGISGAVTGIAGILNEVVSKVNSTIGNVNSSLSGIEKAFTFSYDVTTPDGKRRWGKYSMNLPRVNTVPYLAKGAVIPPRSEFLAVLGDQKQGNNIETPEALLRKIVREETAGRQTGGGSYRFTAQINRRTLFDEMMKEAQMRRDTSGRNPFEMA